VGAGTLLFGAVDVLGRGTRPAVAAIISVGPTAVVFVTYFILGVAGYRLSSDGTVRNQGLREDLPKPLVLFVRVLGS
jgi:hypothetical protein